MCGNDMSIPAVAPKIRHTGTVIFLHGLGDTGHGWCAGLETISEPHIKYLCPSAPIAPVTLNFGMKMPSWFDIRSLNFSGDEDVQGVKKAASNLMSLVDEEVKNGIPSERIIIGGFSQGGAVSLYTALTSTKKFAGVIGLSTFLPLHSTFPEASSGANKDTPIFQAHGDADPVVNYRYGSMTHELLKKLNTNAQFKTYGGLMHSSSDQEMNDVREFIRKILPVQEQL